MNTPLTEQDLIQLNAYLDGELTAAERAEMEARLSADARLQAELDSLRVTAAVLGMAERVRVPRSFTLDPAVYGQTDKPRWWESLSLGTLPMWATAGVTALAVLVCGGIILLQSGMGGMATSAPMADEMVAQAPPTEEPAPAEEAMPAAAEPYDMVTAEAEATEEATEAVPAPTLSLPTASGGVGGGPPQATATAETMPDQRNGIESGTDSQATSDAAASLAVQKQPTEGLTEGTLYQSYTASAEPSTPTPARGGGKFLGLPVTWVVVLGGAIILIAGGTLISIALKRRSR